MCQSACIFAMAMSLGLVGLVPEGQEELQDHLAVAAKYLEADVTEMKQDPAPGRVVVGPAISAVVKGVGRLPEENPTRREAIRLARKYAKVTDLQKGKDPGSIYHHQAHTRLHFSWGVLLETKIIHRGQSLQEAIDILGQPTSVKKDFVEWYYQSPMHVNPCLRCTLREGQTLEEIKVVAK